LLEKKRGPWGIREEAYRREGKTVPAREHETTGYLGGKSTIKAGGTRGR